VCGGGVITKKYGCGLEVKSLSECYLQKKEKKIKVVTTKRG